MACHCDRMISHSCKPLSPPTRPFPSAQVAGLKTLFSAGIDGLALRLDGLAAAGWALGEAPGPREAAETLVDYLAAGSGRGGEASTSGNGRTEVGCLSLGCMLGDCRVEDKR